VIDTATSNTPYLMTGFCTTTPPQQQNPEFSG
jgi:hypothetical protein